MIVPFYTPKYESSSCFSSSPTLGIVSLFHFNHPNGCVEVSHGVNLHFTDDFWCWELFHVFTGHFFFVHCLLKFFVLLKKLDCLFIIELYKFFIYSWHESFVRYMRWEYFPQSVACLFIFLMSNVESWILGKSLQMDQLSLIQLMFQSSWSSTLDSSLTHALLTYAGPCWVGFVAPWGTVPLLPCEPQCVSSWLMLWLNPNFEIKSQL